MSTQKADHLRRGTRNDTISGRSSAPYPGHSSFPAPTHSSCQPSSSRCQQWTPSSSPLSNRSLAARMHYFAALEECTFGALRRGAGDERCESNHGTTVDETHESRWPCLLLWLCADAKLIGSGDTPRVTLKEGTARKRLSSLNSPDISLEILSALALWTTAEESSRRCSSPSR